MLSRKTRDEDVTVLQILQVQRVMKSHEVRMTGDPPEGHVVLERERKTEKSTNEHITGKKKLALPYHINVTYHSVLLSSRI